MPRYSSMPEKIKSDTKYKDSHPFPCLGIHVCLKEEIRHYTYKDSDLISMPWHSCMEKMAILKFSEKKILR